MIFGFGKRFVVPALAAMVFNVVGCSGPESLDTNPALVEHSRAAVAMAASTGKSVVTFEDGTYNAESNEVYVTEGDRVMRFEGEQLADITAEVMSGARNEGKVSALDSCSNTENLSHCETVTCQSAQLYRNYNASADDFMDPYATVYYGQTLNIRNAPYRRYGPRGVRVFYAGIWGFVSANCVSGGF
jgi:hypothetical protein